MLTVGHLHSQAVKTAANYLANSSDWVVALSIARDGFDRIDLGNSTMFRPVADASAIGIQGEVLLLDRMDDGK